MRKSDFLRDKYRSKIAEVNALLFAKQRRLDQVLSSISSEKLTHFPRPGLRAWAEKPNCIQCESWEQALEILKGRREYVEDVQDIPGGVRVHAQRLIINNRSSERATFPKEIRHGEGSFLKTSRNQKTEGFWWTSPSFSDNHLKNSKNKRETGAFYEMRGYQNLTKVIDALDPIYRRGELDALKKIRARSCPAPRYREISVAVLWLIENGTFPDRARCLFPLRWLAAAPDRLAAVFQRAQAEEARRHLNEWRRELIAERAREERRAEKSAAAAMLKFKREYPTAPEQRRALIRIFNLHREAFGLTDLSDPAAQDLCLALLVSEIEASESIQEGFCLAG